MKPDEILRRRLTNQHLVGNPLRTPAQVVAEQGAVQAQDFYGALWGLALRVPPITESKLEEWFTAGRILRTHVLRPTWHFVLPADIRWMLKLSAPRVKVAMRPVNRRLGLSAADFKRSNELIRKALKGGKQLTRNEIAFFHKQAGLRRGNEENLLMAHFMMEAELDGIVTSGPRRGKQFTYALLDERAVPARSLSRTDALAELTRRYFNTRGPATAKDFAWWSGLATGDIKAGIAALGSELQKERIEGKDYWFAEKLAPAKDISKQAYLLPNYDEYGIGYADRSAFYDQTEAKRLELRDRPIFSNVVVIKGRMAGTWRRELSRGQVHITLSLLRPLSKTEKTLVAKAAQRYADFLELKLIVSSPQ